MPNKRIDPTSQGLGYHESGDNELGQADPSRAQWAAFTRKYKAGLAERDAKHALELLAVLSHTTSFSVGCYCEDESHCHRSVVRPLLAQNGAKVE
jgi:uncharacterized protein YeaO (DUF488 family)